MLLLNHHFILAEIRYESKEQGTQILLPLYRKEFTLSIRAESSACSRKKRNIEVSVDECFPLEIDLIKAINCGEICAPWSILRRGYLLVPEPPAVLFAKFHFKYSTDYLAADLLCDNHIGKTVQEKAKSLGKGIETPYNTARVIYEYVKNIPFTDERLVGRYKHSKTPTEVIKSNTAKKCVCKAKLFQTLCIAAGIPARTISAEHYTSQDVARYKNQRRSPTVNNSHLFAAFFNAGWHWVDPTIGGFDLDFKVQNYYLRIIRARGIDALTVAINEM